MAAFYTRGGLTLTSFCAEGQLFGFVRFGLFQGRKLLAMETTFPSATVMVVLAAVKPAPPPKKPHKAARKNCGRPLPEQRAVTGPALKSRSFSPAASRTAIGGACVFFRRARQNTQNLCAAQVPEQKPEEPSRGAQQEKRTFLWNAKAAYALSRGCKLWSYFAQAARFYASKSSLFPRH